MELNKKNWDDFDHARWRVQFLRHLLEMHRSSSKRSTAVWVHEDAQYVERSEAAEKVLARFPAEWHTLPDSEIPCR